MEKFREILKSKEVWLIIILISIVSQIIVFSLVFLCMLFNIKSIIYVIMRVESIFALICLLIFFILTLKRMLDLYFKKIKKH